MTDIKALAEKIADISARTFYVDPDKDKWRKEDIDGLADEIESLLAEVVDEAVKEFAEVRRTYTTHDFTREKEIEYQARAEAYDRAAEVVENFSCQGLNMEVADNLAERIRGLKGDL